MTGPGNRWNVIIIGGGPGGLSAAMWCAELGLEPLLIERSGVLGGQLHNIHNPIENYLGLHAKNGAELCSGFLRSAERLPFERMLDSNVRRIFPDRSLELEDGSRISADAIIVATGVRRRRLGIEGEAEFRGRGILESGARDRELVRGKRVIIVGGGDAAFENALILGEVASQVTVALRRAVPTAREDFVKNAAAKKNIELLRETTVGRIGGERNVEWVEVRSRAAGEVTIREVDAVLIRIGVEPNIELLRDLIDVDEHGYARIDANCRTSDPNIFVVGDLANPHSPTISTATGNGATAAKTIYCSLKR